MGKRAAELETLVPVTQFKREADSLKSWTLDLEKRSNGEVEVLVPVVGRDLEKLVPVISGHSKRELEKLVPVVPVTPRDLEKLIPVVSGHSKRELEKLVPVTPRDVGELEQRKTIPPVDQLDPGSMAPDAITTLEKRKTIPPADQLDPGSVSPDSVGSSSDRTPILISLLIASRLKTTKKEKSTLTQQLS